MAIYFVQDMTTGAVKVGYSRDPRKNRNGLRTASPYSLELLGEVPGRLSDQRALHTELSESFIRLAGEWYEGTQAFMEKVREIIDRSRAKTLQLGSLGLLDAARSVLDSVSDGILDSSEFKVAIEELREAVRIATPEIYPTDGPPEAFVKARPRRDVASRWMISLFRRKREWPSDEFWRVARENGITKYAIDEARIFLDLPRPRRIVTEDGTTLYTWWVPSDWPHLRTDVFTVL